MKNNSIISYYKGDISDSFKDNQDYCYKHFIYNKIVSQYLYADGYVLSSIGKTKAKAIKMMLTSYDDFIKNAHIQSGLGNFTNVIFKHYQISVENN
jgi:hypothetical protein